MAKKKMVVAYSGGLDTSVMVHWLKQKYDADLITVTGHLGQTDEIIGLEEKAKQTGAVKSYIVDLQKEFIEEYCWKALKAGALYEGIYPMATAIGRPLLAKLMVDIAMAEGADTVAHGCTGKGNDQVRFETGIMTLAPDVNLLAPLRFWEFKSREEEIDYAAAHNIPIRIKKDSPYSIDENLWGIAIECGVLEDPTMPPPEDAYQMTHNPKTSPDHPESVSIHFEKGIPVALNGISLTGVELVKQLNTIAGRNGVGRMDVIENRVVGIKSREVYEAPAAVVLHNAHKELEKMVFDKETFRYKQDVSNKIANMIYDGLWFSPLFDALMAFVDSTQEHVTGTIVLELWKGNIRILSRDSVYSLYNKELATYTEDDTFNHKAADGFLALYGLPYKTRSKVHNAAAEMARV
ncbi:MAG: argininosuccinate synthase [Ignavibacteria bacterium]|nr:argininosuccinate synthase [Ignavibacteria bacterium]